MSESPPARRDVSGVVLLDKAQGITSNRALQQLKRLFRARKAGHTGSLDPLATGLLPICLGEATKISGYLLNADKRYAVVARLGVSTDTGDAEGDVTQRREVPVVDARRLSGVVERFKGEIEQIPPMHSALKHKGRRLYELARKGQTVERPPRQVHIHSLECTVESSDELVLNVHCSKGTYIRSLVSDIGEALGCGAHVTMLRRTGVEPFDASLMRTLEDLESLARDGEARLDEILIPPDAALGHLPAVNLDEDSAHYVRQGQAVVVAGAPTRGEVRIYAAAGRFLGIGKVQEDGRVGPRRLIHSGQQ